LGELETIVDLFAQPAFWAGAMFGLVGAVLLIAARLILGRPFFGWGALLTLATVAGLADQFDVDADLLGRLGVVFGAGLLIDGVFAMSHTRFKWLTTVAAWLAGSLAVVWATNLDFGGPLWISIALPVATVALAAGLWLLGTSAMRDLVGPLFAIVVAGVWVTVPETDMLIVLLGAALPLGLATLPPPRARVSAAGALALSAVFAWLVLNGGMPRPWTIASSWAVAAAIPMFAALIKLRPGRPGILAVLAVHLIYVALITRVADYTESALVVLAAFVVLGSFAALGVMLLPAVSGAHETVS
jgi:hypothetical protein